MDNLNQLITYHYKFVFSNGSAKEFKIQLDNKTLNLIKTQDRPNPEWTKLNFCKCPNCLLDEESHIFCPIAINIVDIIDYFWNSISHEEVDVFIQTGTRSYTNHAPLQKGLSSLLGIHMVTSGCPVMEKLKPMVRYHLPFATAEETMYRAISTYLLGQFFLHKRGIKPDLELVNLVKIYENVRLVNESFCNRLSNIHMEDASINALVRLDCFADIVSFSINENLLNEIELVFSP